MSDRKDGITVGRVKKSFGKKWILIIILLLIVVLGGFNIFAPRGYLDTYDFTHGDYDASEEFDDVWSSMEEHEDGVIEELSIEKIGILNAAEEEHYQYLSERFGIEEADVEFDFENHYYLIAYGRPVKRLSSDTTQMYADTARGRVPGAKTEWDEETPYESGVVYIYETDKVALVDIEWY